MIKRSPFVLANVSSIDSIAGYAIINSMKQEKRVVQLKNFPSELHAKMKIKAIKNDREVKDEYVEAVKKHLE